MIRLSVIYPAPESARFDHDFYSDKLVPIAVHTRGLTI
jgi:hypothetical protein